MRYLIESLHMLCCSIFVWWTSYLLGIDIFRYYQTKYLGIQMFFFHVYGCTNFTLSLSLSAYCKLIHQSRCNNLTITIGMQRQNWLFYIHDHFLVPLCGNFSCMLILIWCLYFQRYKTTVLRRYNDFVAFYELLLLRFPYRMIPRLPPKKMMGGRTTYFIA